MNDEMKTKIASLRSCPSTIRARLLHRSSILPRSSTFDARVGNLFTPSNVCKQNHPKLTVESNQFNLAYILLAADHREMHRHADGREDHLLGDDVLVLRRRPCARSAHRSRSS